MAANKNVWCTLTIWKTKPGQFWLDDARFDILSRHFVEYLYGYVSNESVVAFAWRLQTSWRVHTYNDFSVFFDNCIEKIVLTSWKTRYIIEISLSSNIYVWKKFNSQKNSMKNWNNRMTFSNEIAKQNSKKVSRCYVIQQFYAWSWFRRFGKMKKKRREPLCVYVWLCVCVCMAGIEC